MREKIKKNKIVILVIALILIGLGITMGINIGLSWYLTVAEADISSWWCELKMNIDSKWCQYRENLEFCEVLCLEEAGLEKSDEYKECMDSCIK